MSQHNVPAFHPHHWHVHEEIVHSRAEDVVRNPDGWVVNAFRIASGVYFASAMTALVLLATGILSPSAVGGRLLLCAGAGFVASVVALVAGVLYEIPHTLGGHLWSIRLAWTHFVALNIAIVLPLWFLVYDRTLADLAAGEILAMILVLHAGAIAAFIGNMVESIMHMDWLAGRGPR